MLIYVFGHRCGWSRSVLSLLVDAKSCQNVNSMIHYISISIVASIVNSIVRSNDNLLVNSTVN